MQPGHTCALWVRVWPVQEPREDGYFRLDIAFRRHHMVADFFSTVGDTIAMWGMYSQRKYVEPLANGPSVGGWDAHT